MLPISPAPVISRSSAISGKERAVWVALPKGSMMEAISSGMRGSLHHVGGRQGKVLDEGTVAVDSHSDGVLANTELPRRQLRQCPQAMCPSPVTLSPTFRFSTPLPMSTISPTYSWPMVMGVLMVFCDQSSHL